MQSNPKVSIIIPVYNVEQYLPKCLDSIINQTLKDIEIICINDGSIDNSLSILKEYASKDDRIIIIDKENEGQGIARNLGIKKAKGKYIGFVDPDDWVDIQMFEKMYNQAQKLNSEIVICDLIKYQEWSDKYLKFNFYAEPKTPTKLKKVYLKPKENLNKEDFCKTLLISPCYAWNRIYKRELLHKNNICFSVLRCYEDCIFVLKSHIIANNISYLDDELYYYRLRKTSTLRSYNDRYKDLFITIKEMKEFLDTCDGKLKLNFDFFSVMSVYWVYNNFTPQMQKILLKEAKECLSKENMKELKNKILKDKIKKYTNNIFYIKNTKNKTHKVICLFGVKIKIKYTL